MKKLLLFSVALFTMSASMLADGLTATLQQGETTRFFYGTGALKEAYAAANDGAVITLSAGTFDAVNVAKSITIIGYNALNESYPKTIIKGRPEITADNVRIEGIKNEIDGGGYYVRLGNISNCRIKRCYFVGIEASGTHKNTLIEQSVIKMEYAMEKGVNYTIKNSTLRSFYSMNTTGNKAHITNCLIWEWIRLDANHPVQPCAIYSNNVLGCYLTSSYTNNKVGDNSEFYYNVIMTTKGSGDVSFNDNCRSESNVSRVVSYCYPGSPLYSGYDYPAEKLKEEIIGIDGTIVGTYGGSGFIDLPGIPIVTSATIPPYTDGKGNLNIKISAITVAD